MRSLPWLCLLLAGCAGLHVRGGEGPPAEPTRPTYRVWHDDGVWHLRASPGGAPHRFQGSLEGQTGGVGEPSVTAPTLRDQVARLRNTIQFDFEADRAEVGFDAHVTGGCIQFDLYVDGVRRPDRVRFGPAGRVPNVLPAVTCP